MMSDTLYVKIWQDAWRLALRIHLAQVRDGAVDVTQLQDLKETIVDLTEGFASNITLLEISYEILGRNNHTPTIHEVALLARSLRDWRS